MTGKFFSRNSALAFWLALFLFAVYLLSFSGRFHVMDELAVFTAGHNLAHHGRADINQLIWTNHWTPNPPGIWGVDGNLYTKKAPGISFLAAPLIWLGRVIPGLNTVHAGLLTNSLVTALTAGLLFLWLVDLGFSRPAAMLTGLAYGLGTIAWVYARMFWESSLLALFFLGAVWAARRAAGPGRFRGGWLLLAGLFAAIGLSLRFEAAVAVGLIGLYVWLGDFTPPSIPPAGGEANPSPRRGVVSLFSKKRGSCLLSPVSCLPVFSSLPYFILYLLPSLMMGAALLYFNWARFGSLTETGYSREILFRAPWVGGYGLLFSPGRGLFIYAPLTLSLFWGLRPAWRRLSRVYFGLVGSICLFYWLFYGSWFAWGGSWGWGPRFLLPVLPLLMLFVAEPIERVVTRRSAGLGLLLLVLAGLSLAVNLLGIAVDFNEHFMRLGRNDNFVFNWAAFPPLAHWRILREGLVDIIWLRADGAIVWSILTPALLLLSLAALGLGHAAFFARHPFRFRTDPLLMLLIAGLLTYRIMIATADLSCRAEQAQADWPILQTLNSQARPGDLLLMPMPPFGDVQEITTRLMAEVDRPLPTYAWIDGPPRQIEPEERANIWRAVTAEANRIWLFERWLTQAEPTGPTATRLNREAFPASTIWAAGSGRLTLYGFATTPAPPGPARIPFEGGPVLIDYTVFNPVLSPGQILKLRLTWRLPPLSELAGAGESLSPQPVTVFAQLLDGTGPAAQIDRLLIDLQQIDQSPLLPGETVAQGYGLLLPDDLPPGSYPLIIGLYRPGGRLFRADGSPDDFLYLLDVTVQ